MDQPRSRAVIALVNANAATCQALRTSLEGAGFSTVSPGPRHVHDGRLDLVGFLRDQDPAVVVYHLDTPYAESWRTLRAVADTEAVKARYVILTTTDRTALEQALGPIEAVEIGDGPFEHHELVRTVRRTLEARAQGTQPQ